MTHIYYPVEKDKTISDDLVKRLDNLWLTLEKKCFYTEADTVMLAKIRIEELETENKRLRPATETEQQGTDPYEVTFVSERKLEDGSVVMAFDIGQGASHKASELGLKFLLYVGALGITFEKAFDAIWNTHGPKGDDDDGN